MATPSNLLEHAYHWETTRPDRVFLVQPLGKGEVRTWTFQQALDEARRMASHLVSLELPEPSQIAICSKSCAYWVLADLAIWMAGHVSVPVFPTLTPELVRHTLEHSESKLLFVGKLDSVWEHMRSGVPDGLERIAFPLAPPGNGESWDALVGKQQPLATPRARRRDELATIIYTSGSTGVPKGVMQSFGAMLDCTLGIDRILHLVPEDRYLSYLPIAHAMERWLGECLPLYGGLELHYAESLETFVQDLQRARPTLFLSVPRLWLKFQRGVYEKMPPKKLGMLLRLPIVRGLVKKKILAKLGLDQVRFAGSGSAPLPAELLEWYRRLGLELLEGYGMTENFNYSHLTKPGQVRPGYIGTPYHDVECRLSPEGEVLMKGPGLMMGYFKMPEETAESLTDDGFLRTGDRGDIDELGRLKLTGRTKELFKTSKGKYIAPVPIENLLVNHPCIELCCVSGAAQSHPYALVQLSDAARAEATGEGRGEVERQLVAHLERINAELLGHERLRFLAVVAQPWTPENGLLTPTMKIRRGQIERGCEAEMAQWYEAGTPVVWQEAR
jgi:long-chain acyl-CoA synthetase